MAKILAWIKKNGLILGAAGLLAVSMGGTLAFGLSKAKNADERTQKIESDARQLKIDHAELKKKYADLESDRNNVLDQTKKLLVERSKYTETEEAYDQLKKSDEILLKQKDKLHRENEKLRKERDSVVAYFEKMKESYQQSQAANKGLETELGRVRRSLADKVENAPEYKAIALKAQKVEAENGQLKAAVKMLQDTLKKTNERLKKIAARENKMKKQILTSEKSLQKAKKDLQVMAKTNQGMNQAVQIAPQKFSKMAEENKRLVRETAEMHFNLGVFYTKNHNSVMAVKEFERALQIDPNSAKGHYNLAYLYAEELDKHDEAMAHFKRFLEIDPHAREAETVRSYLLERQSFGDRPAVRR